MRAAQRSFLLRFCLTITLCSLLTAGVGCTREAPQNEPQIKAGDSKPVFGFDWKHAQALTLAKADPRSGDHWMARVERQQEKPTSFFDFDPWLIQAYSESGNLPDRLANRNFILHLLDTLSTLHTTGQVDTIGGDYGLNPPRYALEWKAWNEATGQSQVFQVEIGNPVDPSHPANAESYGVFPPSKKIYKVDGAAIAMLDYVKNFSGLRHESLSPLTSDDVDEIEIFRGRQKILYAQREGDRWTNVSHKTWKKDIGGFLDRITHLRIAKFIDSDLEGAGARASVEQNLIERIVLKDRAGHPVEFRFAKEGQRPLATVSTRGSAVFELYPSALDQKEPK